MNKRKGFKKDISNPDDLIGKRVRITYTGLVSHANKYFINLKVKETGKRRYVILPNIREAEIEIFREDLDE